MFIQMPSENSNRYGRLYHLVTKHTGGDANSVVSGCSFISAPQLPGSSGICLTISMICKCGNHLVQQTFSDSWGRKAGKMRS